MNNQTLFQTITDKIILELEKGTVPWNQLWRQDGTLPMNLNTKKAYRGINLCLLPKNYKSPYFLTFNQCKDLGGYVKKGEKSSVVVFWKFSQIIEDEETGEITKCKTIPLLKYYNVFNVEQCENIPESKIPPPPKLNNIPPIEKCEQIISNMPNKPEIREGEARAYYQPSNDIINMPKKGLFDTAEDYYNVLFHELTHSTGHEKRLKRDTILESHGFGSKTYSKEELIAEMGSAFLCGFCGISTSTIKNSTAYIQSWLNVLKNDNKLVVVAAGKAQKATDYILNNKNTL